MIITLLTDFGTADSYVGEVKGVLLTLVPSVTLVDISHHVALGDIRAASFLLSRTWQRFPTGSVHLVVVDPGVGTARRALAAASQGHGFVAPDNGVLSPLARDARFVELPIPPNAAPTFHGRDVFAPAAAHLALGAALTDLGRPVTDPYRSPLPAPRREGRGWEGVVVHVDRFGTLITNLPAGPAASGARVHVGGRDAGPPHRTFADVAPGEPVAYVGSGGTIEIAVRDGSAAQVFGAAVGSEVRMSL